MSAEELRNNCQTEFCKRSTFSASPRAITFFLDALKGTLFRKVARRMSSQEKNGTDDLPFYLGKAPHTSVFVAALRTEHAEKMGVTPLR